MSSSFIPLTTVKEASVQSGLTIKELNKLIKDKIIVASKIGGSILYVDNVSLAEYVTKIREESAKKYLPALQEAIHKAKVEAVREKAKSDKEKKLSDEMLNLYNQTKDKNKKALENMITDILQSLESASDTEYKALIKKPIGKVVDIQRLRDINNLKEPDTITYEEGYTFQDIQTWNEIIKKFDKSQKVKKKLVKKFNFTEKALEEYYEDDSDLTKVVNDKGQIYNFTVKGYEDILEFFKTYKGIKNDYETKIDYPLDKSVIAEIEKTLKAKFHIQEVS